MKLQKIRSAFTLIELLVVITIIGILATGAVSVYTTQIQKARDSNRITDIEALRWGIENFYQDMSVYPLWSTNWKTAAAVDMQDFLPVLAQDPKHNQPCNGSRCGYVYYVWFDSLWITQGAYELSTAFENQGNITWKATNDSGNDNARLEVWTLNWKITATAAVAPFNTASVVTTSFAWAWTWWTPATWTPATTTTNPLVIVKSNVFVK